MTAARVVPGRVAELQRLLPTAGTFGTRRERYGTYRPDLAAADAGQTPETVWTVAPVLDVASDGGPGADILTDTETLWQIGVVIETVAERDPAREWWLLNRIRPMGPPPAGRPVYEGSAAGSVLLRYAEAWLPADWFEHIRRAGPVTVEEPQTGGSAVAVVAGAAAAAVPGLPAADWAFRWRDQQGGIGGRQAPDDSPPTDPGETFPAGLLRLAAHDLDPDMARRRWLLGVLSSL